jgi:dimethylhistidine N-methyltransferase
MLDFLPPNVREPEVAEAALDGLLRDRKTLPAKLFYDAEGCRLFGEITRLPEYYVTRTELALLAEMAPDFGAVAPVGAALVEYGASREDKALMLLAHMRAPQAYVPIDVAEGALAEVKQRMAGTLVAGRTIAVHPVAGDFLEAVALPDRLAGMPVVGFFPGSTIGNLDPDDAVTFLGTVAASLGTGALFLVGTDLRKDRKMLIPAYDDAAGVTAAFNRNLLTRLNREAGGEFDLSRFAHEARWNDDASRIEMHLVSTCDQTVRVAGVPIGFTAGESIHTENSYKHSVEGFRGLAERAGWRALRLWTDPRGLFALHLLQAGDVT